MGCRSVRGGVSDECFTPVLTPRVLFTTKTSLDVFSVLDENMFELVKSWVIVSVR